MFIHLLKILINQSLKEKGYTMSLIFTIALGLVFSLSFIGLIEIGIGNVAPEVHRDRTLHLNDVTFIKDGKEVIRNYERYHDKFTSSFLNEHIKAMKSPENVSIFTSRNGSFEFSNDGIFNPDNFFTYRLTDAEFWEILTMTFVEGKPFTAEQVSNAEAGAVIDTELSLHLFGKTNSVGMTFQGDWRNRDKLTVVGVVEKGNPLSTFTSSIYCPYTLDGNENRFRNKEDEEKGIYMFRGKYQALLLAKDKADFPAIKAELNKIAVRLNQTGKVEEFEGIHPVLNDAYGKLFIDLDLDDMPFGVSSLMITLILIVILIPAFPIIRINTSRIVSRLHELGVRRSVGATRQHILVQFLYENLIITLLGGILGFGFTAFTFNYLLSIFFPDQAILSFGLSGSGLMLSVLIIFIFSLFTGIIPAWKASRTHPVYALSDGQMDLFGGTKKSYDKVSGLAIGGIFISMVLIFVAFIMMSIPMVKLRWVSDLNAHGFSIDTSDDKILASNFQYRKSEFNKVDGIKNLSFTDAQPLDAFGLNDYKTPTGEYRAKIYKVDESYDKIIGLEMISGNWFTKENDQTKPNHKKAIISNDAAELFFGTQDCIGRTFQDKGGVQYNVVGINKTKVLRKQGQLEKWQVFVYSPEYCEQVLMQLEDDADINVVWGIIKDKTSNISGISLGNCESVSEEYARDDQGFYDFAKASM